MADLKAHAKDLLRTIDERKQRAIEDLTNHAEWLKGEVKEAAAVLPELAQMTGLEMLERIAAGLSFRVELHSDQTEHVHLDINGYHYGGNLQSRTLPRGHYRAVLLFFPLKPTGEDP